jgi:D-amino-acid oxidase
MLYGSSSKLPGNMPYGHSFSSYIIHAPNYTAHLGRRVRSLGIPIHRHRLSSLDEAYELPFIGPVDLVVNASGLGARSMIGVEDVDVYPASGQTVLVKAPLVRSCVMHVEGFMPPALKPGEGAFCRTLAVEI